MDTAAAYNAHQILHVLLAGVTSATDDSLGGEDGLLGEY